MVELQSAKLQAVDELYAFCYTNNKTLPFEFLAIGTQMKETFEELILLRNLNDGIELLLKHLPTFKPTYYPLACKKMVDRLTTEMMRDVIVE